MTFEGGRVGRPGNLGRARSRRSIVIAGIALVLASTGMGRARAQDATNRPGSSSSGRLFDFSDLKDIDLSVDRAGSTKPLEAARKPKAPDLKTMGIEQATLAIRQDPGNLEAYRSRAEDYASKGLYRQAISDLSRVLWIEPGDRMSFLRRGYYSCQDRDYERGFADLALAYELSSTDRDRAVAHHWRGDAYTLRGEFALALAEYDRSIGLGSDYARIFQSRGCALAKLREHGRAIVDFDRSLAIDRTAATYYWRAESRLAKGEYALAQADYERAIEADPQAFWAHGGRGWSRLIQGQIEGAIEDFNRGLAISPEYSWCLMGRGWAYLARHELDPASDDFEKALTWQGISTMGADAGFSRSLSLHPIYDRAVDEFYRRCRDVPNLRWSLIVLRGDEARSQLLEFPYFAAYLVCRTRADSQIAPNLVLRVVAQWRSSRELTMAAIGGAIVAARQSRWDEISDYLDQVSLFAMEWVMPGSMRPPLNSFFSPY